MLCSGVVVVGGSALHGDLSGWVLLRRREKDGIVCKFGCQLLCGVNSSAAVGGQFLRKCVLGRKGIPVQTCLELSAPRKSPNCSWLGAYFSTRITFSCFLLI